MATAALAVKHTAAGQYLGFAIQPVRLCRHLLAAKADSKVSLEYLDDIAVHSSDGSLLLEQCKSSLSGNPLSNWSVDLWKTIATWIDLIESGDVDLDRTSFVLYVTTKKAPGKFCRLIHSANTPEEGLAFLRLLNRELNKRTDAPLCIKYLNKILSLDINRASELICRIEIEAETNPIDSIMSLLDFAVQPSAMEMVCASLIGIAKDRIDDLIRLGETPILDVKEYRKKVRAFLAINLFSNILPSTPTASREQIDGTFIQKPIFIRQLRLVDIDQDDQIRAVGDYLRSSADKSSWSEQGLIYDRTLSEWDDELLARFSAFKGEIKDLYSEKDAKTQGSLLYRRCGQVNTPLAGRTVAGYFINGCYNDLANETKLGWHPQYADLLKGEKDD